MQSDFNPASVKHIKDLKYLNNIASRYKGKQIFILTDKNTAKYCLPLIECFFSTSGCFKIIVNEGENHKSIETVENIWKKLILKKATRNSLLINLGGGIITDIGGFVASTYKRGMNFINIPTSLMAQVDAAIGGKNGVNFLGYKNQIGIINQPEEVLIYPGFLKTLDKENYLSGYAEIIKYGFISQDFDIDGLLNFNPLQQHEHIENLIRLSVKTKINYVKADPFEKNIRKALNFGHTFAHAFESLYVVKNKNLLHGYAVAAGLICELYLSCIYFNYPIEELEKVKKYIFNIYGLLDISTNDFKLILEAMQQDKKNINNQLIFTLVTADYEVKINVSCKKQEIFKSLEYYLVAIRKHQ